MGYSCLTTQVFQEGDYRLLPIRKQDMTLVKEWRNQQIEILRQRTLLSDEDQVRYFDDVLSKDFAAEQPEQLIFSFLFQGVLIGYGGLTHIDWFSERAEVSFLLNPQRTADEASYAREFSIFLQLIKTVAFEELHLHKLYTETYDIRPHHVMALESFGFQLEGRLKDHVKIKGRFFDSLIHGFLHE